MSPSTANEVRIGIALSAALLFFVIVVPASFRQPERADFGARYAAGLVLRTGHAGKLYDLGEQQGVQEALFGRKGLLIDPYPPFVAELFSPLTRLRYRTAYLFWGGVNVGLWTLFQCLFFFECRRYDAPFVQPFRCLLLTSLFFPLWVALLQGQFSVLLLVSFCLAFLCLKRGREYVGGLALGIGLLKFQIVLPFALIMLLRRKWGFIAGLSSTGAVLGLMSLWAVGPSGLASYWHLMIDIVRHPSNPAYATMAPSNMPTIRGIVAAILGSTATGAVITVVLSGLLILSTAWRWEKNTGCAENSETFDLMFSAALVVSLVTAPHLYTHDLTPVLLAVVLVVTSSQWTVRSSPRLILTLAIAVLYASPLYLSSLIQRGRLFALAPVLLMFALATLSLGGKKYAIVGTGGTDRCAGAPKATEPSTAIT